MTPRRLKILLAILIIFPSVTVVAQVSGASEKNATAEGLELLRAGQAAQAKLKFDAAIKAAPQSSDAYTWRGISENQLTQYAAAVKDFQSALRINPALLAAHYNLALSFIRLHETDHAIEQLRIVTVTQPSVLQPRYNLAILLESKGLISEAITELTAAHALDSTDKGVTLHLLIDELKQKKTGQTPSLISDIADASTPTEIQRQAGTALVEAGLFDAAVPILEGAHEREPNAPGIISLLARAYIGDQKNAEAIALLQTVPADKSSDATYLLALAYAGAGNKIKAAEAFATAARTDPKDARPLYHLGLLAAASSGPTTSVDYFRSAMKLDPANPIYSLALARVLLVTDQADEAKKVLATVEPTGSDASQVHALKGVAAAATHGIDEAIPQLRKAVEEDPSLALAHNVLGFCLFQQGHYAEAAKAYGIASTLEPKRLLYARDSALAYERANQPAEALRFAEQANALPNTDASDHLLLGKLYAASGRKPDAIRELERAAELNPNLDAACYLLARTYMQMGDKQQATIWNDKLTALKQRHTAELDLQKKSAAVRSSTLLQGGSLSADDPGTP
jgi:tetratricopeptide (TPR) repeat protein